MDLAGEMEFNLLGVEGIDNFFKLGSSVPSKLRDCAAAHKKNQARAHKILFRALKLIRTKQYCFFYLFYFVF